MLHVVLHIRLRIFPVNVNYQRFLKDGDTSTHKVNLGFMAHIAYNLWSNLEVCGVDERSTAINVISTKTIDDALNRGQGSLVQNQVARENVH